MPLYACRHIRKMRGGAQAQLIQVNTGDYYVVKFVNNPQHRRILVNECVAAVFLNYLQIASPETAVIEVGEQFLGEYPEVAIQLGQNRIPVPPGWHFGSRFPGDPDKLAIYDFVPDALLRHVVNLSEFLGMLVFDKWMANADGRQCVFFRAAVQQWNAQARERTARRAFMAMMIDQGFVFNGPHWDFPDSPVQGLYHRPLVYESVRSLDDFQPWLDRVVYFPEHIADKALRQIPMAWMNGDAESLEALIEQLFKRRQRVPDLIVQARKARPQMFPNWR